MGGFSAISAGNGWLIAALGISIVFFGLASLAFMITYFPRAIRWWNDHAQSPKYPVQLFKSLFSQRETEATISADTVDIEDAANNYNLGDRSEEEKEELRKLMIEEGEKRKFFQSDIGESFESHSK